MTSGTGMRNIILFPGITLFTLTLFLVALALFYHTYFSYGPAERSEYLDLLAKADPKQSHTAAPYTATQQHHQAHKDIWFNKNGQRLQLRLRSADTELVLDHHDDKTEVLEHMRGVKCYLQEELFYLTPDGREAIPQPDGKLLLRHGDANDPQAQIAPSPLLKPMQNIRYMEADAATYYYQNDHFVAERVKVSRFAVPGHKLIESVKGLHPLMTGIAQAVEFSLAGNDLNFTAYQLKATFHSSGGGL
jgi:hypothetical protein